MMKKSINGKIKEVIETEKNALVVLDIPVYMAKHFHELDPDKPYNFYITEVRKRRTLEQNNIAWGIMREIARNMDLVPDVEDVYRQILAHANIKSEFMMLLPEAKEELQKREIFRVIIDHGAREFEAKDGTKLHMYECLYGMSKFNRKEMSRFIESLLYFAEMYDVNIEMYERW